MRIWELEQRILNSVPLSPDEMRVVEEALVSEEISQRVLACEAMLRLGDDSQMGNAVNVLSKVIQDANSGRCDLTSNLIMAFFSLPEPVLDRPEFRLVLTNAASHSDESVRINCMVALVPLVKAGKKWPEALLEAGLRDSSGGVRQNARVGLSLKPKGPNEKGPNSNNAA